MGLLISGVRRSAGLGDAFQSVLAPFWLAAESGVLRPRPPRGFSLLFGFQLKYCNKYEISVFKEEFLNYLNIQLGRMVNS